MKPDIKSGAVCPTSRVSCSAADNSAINPAPISFRLPGGHQARLPSAAVHRASPGQTELLPGDMLETDTTVHVVLVYKPL